MKIPTGSLDKRGGLLARMHIDAPLLSGVIALCLIGVVVLFSASGKNAESVLRHVIHMCVGLVAMVALAQITPTQYARWSPWLYGFGLILLLVVLTHGTGKGARRWLDLGVLRFQPSELMKIGVPIAVAWYLGDKAVPPRFLSLLIGLLLIAVPVALIARQPDLGTAVMIVATGISVLYFSGISWRLIAAAGLLAVGSAPLLWYHMHDYQRQRIWTLWDPEKDPLGSGYHIIQAKIAVGSGGLYGKGWLNGTQSHLEFIPERSTDFIFAVFCEEFGFIGVLVLVCVYVFVVLRGLYIAATAQGTFSRLFAASLSVTLFTYVFVNMGMVSGQLPVVGIPLPLVSYGGTSLVTLLAGFGILMSIQTHKSWLSG
ncbi:MAG: rod shape-determining protein RodA [Gammaproteobacteria bacterium]